MSFGQEDITVVQSKTSISNETNIENELVLSDEKTTVKTPLTADLSNYTHLLLVDINLKNTNKYYTSISFTNEYAGFSLRNDFAYKPVQNLLNMGVFEIINPIEFNRRNYKKNNVYLKKIKEKTYLYLYLSQNKGKGDDLNTTFIIRDWKNKLIYNATHINTGLNEVLAPLIDY
jgi:hypothetical protein